MAAAVFHGKNKENLMAATFHFVKDDPCYGCKFAVPKNEKQIQYEGIFTRRFSCANRDRRDQMELEIIRAIVSGDYAKAMKKLSTLVDSKKYGNGLMPVVDAAVPFCYQKKEEPK